MGGLAGDEASRFQDAAGMSVTVDAWALPVTGGVRDTTAAEVRRYQEEVVRGGFVLGRLDIEEFERRMAALLAADEWGWQ